MGAGILPITIHNGKLLFLFSREYIGGDHFDNGLWSDFGGGSDKNESIRDTAVRECFEESDGFLGNIKTITKLVKSKTIKKLRYENYTTYIVYIKYDENLPRKFKKKFSKIKNNSPELILKNGLYEKDLLKWVEYSEIRNFYNSFRPFYKNIVNLLLKKF